MGKAHHWGAKLAALAAALACAGAGFAQQALDPGIRLGLGPSGTRVVLDAAAKVDVVPARSDDGRMVFDISGLEASQPLFGPGLGLVKAWRLEKVGDVQRLTLELGQKAEIAHRFLIPPTVNVTHFRYVIDLTPALAAVRVAQAAPTATRAQRIQPAAHKLVVIDPGHGGHDPGAQNGDVNEKDITLAAALYLRHRLELGGYRVLMTRSTDMFVPLEQRVRIARRSGADLFIALHADSAGGEAATHGASVYTLSDHGVTRVNQVLDGHEWFNHAARSDPAVDGILLDLTQRSTLNRSNLFAQLLVDRLSAKVDLLPRSHRDAGCIA
jgi:N-acetylmuramoyl-L-alanine amidase